MKQVNNKIMDRVKTSNELSASVLTDIWIQTINAMITPPVIWRAKTFVKLEVMNIVWPALVEWDEKWDWI